MDVKNGRYPCVVLGDGTSLPYSNVKNAVSFLLVCPLIYANRGPCSLGVWNTRTDKVTMARDEEDLRIMLSTEEEQ